MCEYSNSLYTKLLAWLSKLSIVGHTTPRTSHLERVSMPFIMVLITSNLQNLICKSIWNQLVFIINPWKNHKLFYVAISEGMSSYK